jgi:predicted kinase
VKDGHIRDGHGDLRTDHIYFHQGIQIIDCIEFNDRFRYGDTALDLAFLYMDMEHLGYPEWGRSFLSAYVRTAGDPQLYTVIEFYAAYRALVRLKVDAFRYREASPGEREDLKRDIHTYFKQAYRYAVQFGRPTLWVVCGLPATGKSSLAEALSEVLSVTLFQSDQLRKAAGLTGDVATTAFGEGPYRLQRRQQIYADLLGRGHETLRTGHSVILDATFSRRKWREEAQRLANDLDANLIFVETACREETIRDRLKHREVSPGLSDARLVHLPDMRRTYEPLEERSDTTCFRINSEDSPESMLTETLSRAFACKYHQVYRRLETQGREG